MKTEGKSCEEPLVPQLETLPKYRCSGCCSCLWIEVDCPVHNICSSVLVFPTPINKPQPINGLLSFFFSPSAAVSVEACPIWLCKPAGSRQPVLFQRGVPSQTSPILCAQLLQSRELAGGPQGGSDTPLSRMTSKNSWDKVPVILWGNWWLYCTSFW